MNIGLIKEIKEQEYRVGLTPQAAKEYIRHGHIVVVESQAGVGSGFSDDDYTAVGCTIESDKKNIFDKHYFIII